jgi:plasmid replication initiation protein
MASELVVKSNKFIEASYRLGLVEAKIILKLASLIKRDDKTFVDYHIPAHTLMKEIGLGERNNDDLMQATENLVSKVASIEESDGILQVSFLASAKYYKRGPKRGMIRFRFDPSLKPYLLQLKEKFTAFRLENTLNLRSVYSIRVYELLKQYENLGERKISLQEFRKRLELKKTEYSLYANFKNRVILPAQRELKQKTDISFEFEEIKEGRSVAELKFFIYRNKEQEKPINLFEQVTMEKMRKVLVFSDTKMRQIIEQYNEEKIEIALKYTKEKARENKEGYFLELLNDPNFGEKEIEDRKKREAKEEKENQKYIEQMEEEAKQKEERKKIDEYIKKNLERYEALCTEFEEINAERMPTLTPEVKNSLAKNYARVEILKEIKKFESS